MSWSTVGIQPQMTTVNNEVLTILGEGAQPLRNGFSLNVLYYYNPYRSTGFSVNLLGVCGVCVLEEKRGYPCSTESMRIAVRHVLRWRWHVLAQTFSE